MIGLLVAYVSEDDLSERRELAERIEEELQQLGEEVSAVQPLFSKIRQSDPDDIEMRAAALTLHGFYNGVEKVLVEIARRFDGHIPGGERWHRALLDQMLSATDDRPALIEQDDYDILVEYLSFRHLVRHSYPGSLSWYRFRDIARDLDKTHGRIENRVRTFVMNVLRKGEDDTKTEDNSTS